ncbi:MAG: carbohydrate ABC transporter permease [Ruminococcaceae bacterium]|nr:carbohydrate ABC transporter permease [Oscillospiraceae bacterium]
MMIKGVRHMVRKRKMAVGRTGHPLAQIIVNLVIIVLLVCLLYPLVMSVFISVKNQEAYQADPWVPTLPMWFSNFRTAFTLISKYMKNTLIVAGISIPLMLLIASVSAFVFARMKFPGRELIYYAVIALMMVPGVLTLIPQYMLFNDLGLLDTHVVLIVPIILGGCVGGIFLLRSFFSGIPEALFEAASLDGCSVLQSYFYICLPLSKAILGTLAIQQIVGIWNDIVWPSITISDPEMWTISAGLYRQFVNTYNNNTPVQFAGYMMASAPLILLFIFANKYYIEGLSSAGIKL